MAVTTFLHDLLYAGLQGMKRFSCQLASSRGRYDMTMGGYLALDLGEDLHDVCLQRVVGVLRRARRGARRPGDGRALRLALLHLPT